MFIKRLSMRMSDVICRISDLTEHAILCLEVGGVQ